MGISFVFALDRDEFMLEKLFLTICGSGESEVN